MSGWASLENGNATKHFPKGFPVRKTPVGVSAISRWLSAAIPPESVRMIGLYLQHARLELLAIIVTRGDR
jgi:hypothetical protein